ncbi:MAG: hypothetical protein AAGF53_16430 [Pseudomonadota bacterium]
MCDDMRNFFSSIFVALILSPAYADEPEVIGVEVEKVGMLWNISVTLSHPDTGWDHYADGWEVLDSNGQSIGFRKLSHPHVNEQPFTRSLTGVFIPDGTREIFVVPRCSEHGWNANPVSVKLQP